MKVTTLGDVAAVLEQLPPAAGVLRIVVDDVLFEQLGGATKRFRGGEATDTQVTLRNVVFVKGETEPPPMRALSTTTPRKKLTVKSVSNG